MARATSSLPVPVSPPGIALALLARRPVLVRDGQISRWVCNRARLVVTARGVHGRNRLEEGMRREGTVAVFPGKFPDSECSRGRRAALRLVEQVRRIPSEAP